MKLFLLRSENYEGVDIYGLYSSKEKAIESLPYQRDQLSEEDIEEIEVDPPNTGEVYEPFFYVKVYNDGSPPVLDSTSRRRRGDDRTRFVRYEWDEGSKRGAVVAAAFSMEEAIAEAKAHLSEVHPV